MSSKPKPESAIEATEREVMLARDVLAGLAEDRRAIEQTAPARQAEIDSLSYSARIEGNRAAKTRLAELHEQAGRHGSELAEIDAATATAERRLAEAEAVMAREAERQRVDDVLAHADKLPIHGARLDAAAAEIAAAVAEFIAEHRFIVLLGCQKPGAETLAIYLRRAFSSALMGTPLQIEHLTAAQRLTFTELGNAWRSMYGEWSKTELRALGTDVGAGPAKPISGRERSAAIADHAMKMATAAQRVHAGEEPRAVAAELGIVLDEEPAEIEEAAQ